MVKDWEKRKISTRTKEAGEIDSAILDLLSTQPSGIFFAEGTSQLSILKSRKESILTQQILTWKLKSRVDWINEGDANTKFFHSYASTRRNSKTIWALKD